MTPASAAIRGRIWRNPYPSMRDYAHGIRKNPHPWSFEVRANDQVLIRERADTHQEALNRVCRHIRKVAQIDATHGLTP